jgi:spermidine synthase
MDEATKRTTQEIAQVVLLRDAYHKIKRYLEDGTSTARHDLWLQGEIIKAHLLTIEDVSIDRDYQYAQVPKELPKTSARSARATRNLNHLFDQKRKKENSAD